MYSLVLIAKVSTKSLQQPLFLHMMNEEKEVLLDTLYDHLHQEYNDLTEIQQNNIEKGFADATNFDKEGFGKGVIGIGHDLYDLSIIKSGS